MTDRKQCYPQTLTYVVLGVNIGFWCLHQGNGAIVCEIDESMTEKIFKEE